MKPVPSWPRISSTLFYKDGHAAIDWLCRAFGFEVRLKVEGDNGKLVHSELMFGDGIVMVAEEGGHERGRSPRTVGANTQSLFAYVDDVVAHCERARKAGAKITTEMKVSDYGEDYWSDKSYGCEDLEGHHWWFSERLRSPAKPSPTGTVKHS